MIDTTTVEKISPEYWRNSQLSISRFSGGCILNGKRYILDRETDHLVREDVYRAEIRDAKKRKRIADAEKKYWMDAQQSGLF